MIVLPQRFLYSMGRRRRRRGPARRGGALLAIPAMLALLGERVNALSLRRAPRAARRLGTVVPRRSDGDAASRPGRARGLARARGGARSPLARATLVQPGNQSVPEGRDARTVTDAIDAEFTPNLDAPITATRAASRCGPGARGDGRLDGVRAVSRPQPLGDDLALLEATPVDEPLSSAAQDTARSIRSTRRAPAAAWAARAPSSSTSSRACVDHAPLVAALVATSTFILLFLLTGSVILPLKTLVMNVFSIVAAFGLTVLVFQDGFGSGLFDYDGPEAIETALLVVVGATTFGLATDYAVLVLARIKEYHDAGEDNETAVALGIERTGRVITAAAVMLAVVFLAFTSSSIFFMKQVGLRPGGGGPDRRVDHPRAARAGADAHARPVELVGAAPAPAPARAARVLGAIRDDRLVRQQRDRRAGWRARAAPRA